MTSYTTTARRFGNLIAKGDFAAARLLLTTEAQATHSPEALKQAVNDMTSYEPGPIQEVEVMEDFIIEDWPEKRDGDAAVVYAALNGEGFCEAVAVTLARNDYGFLIREIVWGRP